MIGAEGEFVVESVSSFCEFLVGFLFMLEFTSSVEDPCSRKIHDTHSQFCIYRYSILVLY